MLHSEDTSVKWYSSHSFSLSPSSLLLQLVCFCLSLQVFTLAGGISALSLPSSSIQVLQLTKPPFIVAQRLLCTSLCHACFPFSLMFWQSADHPASTFPPRPFTPPPDCNNVSKCSSAWRWIGTLFNTTCHISNPRLVTGGGETQSSELRCLWWKVGLAACWGSETPFQWFNFSYSDGNCIPGVFVTLCACVWWGARYQLVLQKVVL